MFVNPFNLQREEYVRDINVIHHYVEDVTHAIQIETGVDYATAHEFALRKSKEAMVDPDVKFFQRLENGDRKPMKQSLSKYIGDVVRGEKILAPTMTVYTPPHIKESILVRYIDANVKARGVAKKAMFKAEMAKNEPVRIIKKIEQTGRKLANNAISGAHVAPGTPLYNKTAHSTLTSNCRVTAGYGNANNEKFLSGNRHYWSPDIVINSITSITRNTDYKELERVLVQFGVRYPSVRETMQCIEYSARLYFQTQAEYVNIFRYVNRLTPLQRAAFVYTGDLYQLMLCNPELVRNFVDRLSTPFSMPHPDPRSVLDNAHEDHVALAQQVIPSVMRGKTMMDVKGQLEEGLVAAVVENIENTITQHFDLIRVLWVTVNVPSSVAHFPDSIRRSALTGDTDSTIFTVQDWVIWFSGQPGFSDKECAVAATMIFLASQTIVHVLAMMSKNAGIETKRLFQTAMKNEFKFDVFTPTQVAKHYFAYISCQEGNLYAKYKKEIKGVHLKTSKISKLVMADAEKLMIFIMEEVLAGRKLSIDQIMKWVGDAERGVMDSIARGSYEYFRSTQIRDPQGYKEGEANANYGQYLMWEEVFAPSYAHAPKPPYMTVKVSTDIKSKSELARWIEGFEDRELAARMAAYVKRTGKKDFNTLQLPVEVCNSKGIPKEIMQRIKVRKMVIDSCKVYYIILEALGVMMLNSKLTRLVSDYH